jgi:hypothetical protein
VPFQRSILDGHCAYGVMTWKPGLRAKLSTKETSMMKDRMEGGTKRPEPVGKSEVVYESRQQRRAEERRQLKKVLSTVKRVTSRAANRS